MSEKNEPKSAEEIIKELAASGETNIKKVVPGEDPWPDLEPGQQVIYEGPVDGIVVFPKKEEDEE